jgi:prepilin-type N-terminal cleavage/methylation domain-containing protein
VTPRDRQTARPAPRRAPRAEGFTLLELILAITILALISVAVLAVFRTGTRTYEESHREMLLLQRSRHVFETFEGDIMNLFYRDETSYNVQAREDIQEYQQYYLEAERTGDWDAFEKRYGPRDDENEAEKDPNYVGNPFEKAKLIDLQFVGQDSEDSDGAPRDSITFTIRQPVELGGDYHFWGLARVEYNVEGDFLIRSVEDIGTAPRTWDGEVLEKEEPPAYTVVAEGVTAFDLKYAFWWDNQWYEAESWSSSNRQVRNNQYLLGDYDIEDEELLSAGLPIPGSASWNDYLNELEDQPLDRLPTYVRMTVRLADPRNPARSHQMVRLFRIPNSLETWVPNQQLEEEDQEMEREERDKEFIPIYPGALKKK